MHPSSPQSPFREMIPPRPSIIVAVTGASGAPYARCLLESLGNTSSFEALVLVASEIGKQVYAYETGEDLYTHAKACCPGIECMDNADLFASPASGSAGFDTMVVVPCSMGTASKIAAGYGDTLITRAAQVMLKEQKKLILAVRETPLNLIHLRALTTLAEAGAMICPAAPAFYAKPENLDALVRAYTDRMLQWMGIPGAYFQWHKPE